MIDVRALEKSFGRRPVLRGLSVAFRPGRVTGIIGANAAGKTTLLKLILGFARPDAGEILVEGTPLRADGADRARMGYMPQIARFPDRLTALELFAMLANIRGGAAPAPYDDDLVRRFALGDALRRPLGVLSGGTRQKISAAVAFRFRPDILILDEPTAGLDPRSREILTDRILTDRAEGKTVLMTLHVMHELEDLVDDVVVLRDGRATFAGSLLDLEHTTQQCTLERAITELAVGAGSAAA